MVETVPSNLRRSETEEPFEKRKKEGKQKEKRGESYAHRASVVVVSDRLSFFWWRPQFFLSTYNLENYFTLFFTFHNEKWCKLSHNMIVLFLTVMSL